MKTKLLFVVLTLITFLPSCKKDLATAWVGTYTGIAGSSTVNRVVISKVDDSTIKIELQAGVTGTFYTYTTLASGKLTTSSAVAINEDGTVYGYTGLYHISGGGSLSGNNLTLSGTATQSGSSTLYYTFQGSKKNQQ